MSNTNLGGDHDRRTLLLDFPIITDESNPPLMAWIYEHGGCRDPHVCMLSEFQNIPKLGNNRPLYLTSTYNQSQVICLDEIRFLSTWTLINNVIGFNTSYTPQYITIPDNWTWVGENMFRSCNWKRIIIGKNVQTCTTRTLYQWRNNDNPVVIWKPEVPPTLNGSNNYVPASTKFYVPDNSVDVYKEQWTDHTSRIYPLSECPPEHLQYHDLVGGTMQI